MRLCNYVLWSVLSMAIFSLQAPASSGAKNLLANGSFDNPTDALSGWKYNYEDTGNSKWAQNHLYVSVTNIDDKKHALDLHADAMILNIQGVMVDSDPVPVTPNGKYRLTASARSTGGNARIFLEGYQWKPGVKPHPNPTLAELRKCYRFTPLYFSGEKSGSKSNVSETWIRASQTFPDGKPSALAKESLDKVQFLVVHIIAISLIKSHVAKDEIMHLYVDDVVLECLN